MIYAKVGAAVALLAAAFWAGWSWNGDRATAAAGVLQQAQLKAAVTALDTQASQRVAAEAKLQTVENQYDAVKDLPDLAAPIIAQRVLYAACPASAPVSRPATVAGGTPGPAPVAIGPSRVAAALERLLVSCDADAQRLTALQALKP